MTKEEKENRKDNQQSRNSKLQPSGDFQEQVIRNRRRKAHNMKIVFSVLCVLLLLLTSFGIWQYYDGQKPPAIGGAEASGSSLNISAPDFSIQDINGTQASLNQYKGNVIAIHFMAVGCHGNINEINQYQLTQLSNAYNTLKQNGVSNFLTIAVATCENSQLDVLRSDYGVSWILGNDYADGAIEIVNSYIPFEIGDGAVILVNKDLVVSEVINGGISSEDLVTKIQHLSGA